jgi:NMD protein affecting ribosome stability and mRNA decay
MFLDEELLEMCVKADCSTPEIIQQLNIDICRKCESYYKSKMYPAITPKELKTILDRTFNLFDLFVKNASKSTDKKLQILGELFKEFSFKQQFLQNEKTLKAYNNLTNGN